MYNCKCHYIYKDYNEYKLVKVRMEQIKTSSNIQD